MGKYKVGDTVRVLYDLSIDDLHIGDIIKITHINYDSPSSTNGEFAFEKNGELHTGWRFDNFFFELVEDSEVIKELKKQYNINLSETHVSVGNKGIKLSGDRTLYIDKKAWVYISTDDGTYKYSLVTEENLDQFIAALLILREELNKEQI